MSNAVTRPGRVTSTLTHSQKGNQNWLQMDLLLKVHEHVNKQVKLFLFPISKDILMNLLAQKLISLSSKIF